MSGSLVEVVVDRSHSILRPHTRPVRIQAALHNFAPKALTNFGIAFSIFMHLPCVCNVQTAFLEKEKMGKGKRTNRRIVFEQEGRFCRPNQLQYKKYPF